MIAHIRAILNGFHDTTMLLSLMLWLCALPLILLFTVPFFGWEVGLSAAVVAFFMALAICWGVCLYPKIPKEERKHAR